MSLRDQLLKSGLVSREQAKKAEADARKERHHAGKHKAAEAARQAEERRRPEAEAERKRERDRELNREREAERKRREDAARIKQLIASHRLNELNAEIRYNILVDGRYIRSVRVTPEQQRLLALGRIGIARNDEDPHDFPLIPRETALKVAAISQDQILLLHPESHRVEEDEGWEG